MTVRDGEAFQPDLTQAYSDREAIPPEWADILREVHEALPRLTDQVSVAVETFAAERDIRNALAGRERTVAAVGDRVDELNAKIKRLNLIAPHSRLQRNLIDSNAILEPLFKTARGGRSSPSIQ